MRCTGFSDVIGSWKTIAISSPADRRSSSSVALSSSWPSSVAEPSKRAFRRGVRPMSVIAVTDLPEPDSPTIAEHLAGAQLEGDVVDGLHEAVLGPEADAEVLDVEQRLAVAVIRQPDPRVERGVDDVDDRVEAATMKNAPNIVIASTGGTSSWLIDSAKYWPTPWRSKTDSVRIAPPPITAPKSRPQQRDDRDQRVAQHVVDQHALLARGPWPGRCARSPR